MEGWLLPALLVAQGLMAGVDTLLNHELIARLPQRPEARTEIGLHVVRETIWAFLFAALAWSAWHGAAAAFIAAVLAAEVTITACDEFVENRSRVLPQNERVVHVFLTLNLGVIIALLAMVLLDWGSRPTAVEPRNYGIASWLITPFALAAAVWAVRDLFAWRRLGYAQEEKT
jgi:hypothetical protein